MKRFFLWIFWVFLIPIIGVSQSASDDFEKGDTGTWFALLNSYQINDKWSLHNELRLRTFNFFENRGFILERPSVGYKHDDNFLFRAGYTYINTHTGAIDLNEHNFWEQVLLKYKLGKIKLSNRIRQEHRWQERLVEDGFSFANRFRFMFNAQRVIYQFREQPDRYFLVEIYDEAFFNQRSGIFPRDLDRNWVYVGAGMQIVRNARVMIGWLNQTVFNRPFKPFRQGNLQLVLNVKFDKKKDIKIN